MAKTGQRPLFSQKMKTKKLKLEVHIHPRLAQLHDGGDSALCAFIPRPEESVELIAGFIASALKVPVIRFNESGEKIKK